MFLSGSEGALEAQFDTPCDEHGEYRDIAILCHPHPQYGGSMHDGVLATAAQCLLNNGYACLRFNFRGVGQSDGQFGQGFGEQEDLVAMINWMQQDYPEHNLHIVGYSFGDNVAFNTMARYQQLNADGPELQQVILIAPPVGMMDFSQTEGKLPPIHAIAGDQDNFVDPDVFSQWQGVNTHLIPGADHFFSGVHTQLAQLIQQVVAEDTRS